MPLFSRCRHSLLFLGICFVLARTAPAAQPPLLSLHAFETSYRINAAYRGTDFHIYGGVKAEFKDNRLVIIFLAPAGYATVEKKAKKFGLWHTKVDMHLKYAPRWLSMATNTNRDISAYRSFEDILHTIMPILSPRFTEVFQNAKFMMLAQQKGLYTLEETPLILTNDGLFHYTFHLPPQLPQGQYRADAYLLDKNGRLLAHRSQSYRLETYGVFYGIETLAERNPFLYGLLSIGTAALLAVILGFALEEFMRFSNRKP